MSTALDILMMAMFTSKERTETDWRELMTSVGLRVVKIWNFNYEEGLPSLIEVELDY